MTRLASLLALLLLTSLAMAGSGSVIIENDDGGLISDKVWPYDQILCHPDALIGEADVPLLMIPKNSKTARWWWEESEPIDVDIAELELVIVGGKPAVRYDGTTYTPCE